MNLQDVAARVVKGFNARKVRFGLIGGFAVGLFGVPRGTLDLDFLVCQEDLAAVDDIMSDLGYRLTHRSENVSHFQSPEGCCGSIDFLHAFRVPSLRMLDRTLEQHIFGDDLALPVIQPDDLIGLKVQAIANDPRRTVHDLADIEELMRLHGRSIDWDLVEDYFALFEMDPLFRNLKDKYAAQ